MTPWNKNGVFVPCRTCQKDVWMTAKQVFAGRKKYCSKACLYKGDSYTKLYTKGHAKSFLGVRVHTEETKKKISENNWMKSHRGELNPFWKGGMGTERHRLMGQKEYKLWRASVFERDNYTCQECDAKGVYLEADHIKPWATHESLRYEISNGRTLCKPCHLKTKTWGRNALKDSNFIVK